MLLSGIVTLAQYATFLDDATLERDDANGSRSYIQFAMYYAIMALFEPLNIAWTLSTFALRSALRRA